MTSRRSLIGGMLLGDSRGPDLRRGAETLEIGVDEQLDELGEPDLGLPPEPAARLRRIPDQVVQLRAPALEARVDADEVGPVEADVPEGALGQLAHRVALAGRDDVVVRLLL